MTVNVILDDESRATFHRDRPMNLLVTLGRYTSPDEYLQAFAADKEIELGPHFTEPVLRQTPCSKIETNVELVIRSVASLGHPDGALYAHVCTAARVSGIKLCPAEVGPALRLQYRDQRFGERLLIGMKPLPGRHGRGDIFQVERDHLSGLSLSTHGCMDTRICRPGDQFVFIAK